VRVAISNDFGWNSELWKHVLEVELCHSFGIDGFITGEKYGHFSTPLISDCEYGVISLQFGQFDNEVHCNGGKQGCVWLGKDRRQWHLLSLVLGCLPYVIGSLRTP
jgi:hypothetical protein